MFQLHNILAILILIAILLMLASADQITVSIVTDKDALISMKSKLSAEGRSSIPSTWDENTSPCNWTGIGCDTFGRRVVSINLSGMGLTGSIAPQIGNLSALTSLQLQNNRLAGAIPDQIGSLFLLRTLNLSNNIIQGRLPVNLTMCKELRILDLMQNEIYGTIPQEINQLTMLQVLNLGRNHLSGFIPPSIGNLSSLNVLNLGTNSLCGTIPNDLSRLRNLTHLDLTINKIFGTVPPSIYNMSSLVNLAFAANDLWGDIPYDVGETLPNLLVFNFCFNKFTGNIPGSLHNLTNIQTIRMAHNLLHGTVPPSLGNLPKLQMYNIGFNRIVSSRGKNGLDFLTSLKNSTLLNFLAIDGNLLEGIIPESIGNLSRVLQKLYMGENRIYGAIPASIGHLIGLTLLNMSDNLISGEIPTVIGNLKNLQVLRLSNNRLSGTIPYSLGNLQGLNHIDLSKNGFVGSIPRFNNFQNLLSMDLSHNKLNGSIPRELLNLPKLSTFLNLSNNLLTGSLPQEIGKLESVVTIDLSNNGLSGSIPNSIGKCKSLEELMISKNMLSGIIPNGLGSLNGLVLLDLSSNQLSGSIPSNLGKLRGLQLLNLSFNNLEGVVPDGGVFENPNKVHIEANSMLCWNVACKIGQGSNKHLIMVLVGTLVPTVLAISFVVVLLINFRKSKEKTTTIPSESFRGKHQMISYDALRLATGNFNHENLIGHGSYGSVYRGCLDEGTKIAVKVLNTEIVGSWKSFIAECAALRNTRHRNLVKLITSCSSLDFKNNEFLALVYEFMTNGSLEDWIRGKRRKEDDNGLNLQDRLKVAIDIASAIDYLHAECDAPVVHCDLKPSNVLLDKDMNAKIGDFGLATILIDRNNDDHSSISSIHNPRGSIGYIPPEYGLGQEASKAGDVYSYGIILLELYTGRSPIHDSFVGGLTLKKWVQMAFPTKVEQVIDHKLISDIEELNVVDHCLSPEVLHDCLVRIIGVGIRCTADSADERISIRDALRELGKVRDVLNF